MNKTYRESRLTIIGLLFSLFVLFLFTKIFIAAIETENWFFIIMMLVVCLTWLKVIYSSLNNIFKKIVLKPQGISITKFWNSVEIRWDEIREFGRIEKKRIFMNTGVDNWIYYLVKRNSENKTIEIGDSNFKGMDEIVGTVLKKAKNSSIMTKRNVSNIPYLKKFESVTWNQ